jgi:hypothetical protein
MRLVLVLLASCTLALIAAGCSYSENSYWYCWDSGAKAPHHLGHYVEGDHVCSDGELKGTGFSPR